MKVEILSVGLRFALARQNLRFGLVVSITAKSRVFPDKVPMVTDLYCKGMQYRPHDLLDARDGYQALDLALL